LFRVPILARQARWRRDDDNDDAAVEGSIRALEELDIQLNTAKEAELTAACNPAQLNADWTVRAVIHVLWWEGYTPLSPLKFQLHFLL